VNSDTSALKRVEMILDEMHKNGQKKYFDTEFGPKDKDDEEGSKMALYTTGESPPGYIKPEAIEWLFPEEFAGEGYKFLNEDASSNEVLQGALGDCWFIGALSVLATRDELLIGGLDTFVITDDFEVTSPIAKAMSEGVYPPIFHSYARYGIYVFRFFKNFSWRYIIIDGRIPCYKSNKQPVFARCKEIKELWVPLIEKAYAKLHMCYESLVSGFIDDGLTDLTGFVAEKINLHDNRGVFPNSKLNGEDKFWEYLESRRKEQSMLG
jgi:calpain